jgi:hypothetical protein
MDGIPVIEYLVAQRLAEARAGASQRAALRALRPAREPVGTRIGRWLIAAARRMPESRRVPGVERAA